MISTFQRAKQASPDLPWCQDMPDQLGPVIMQYILDKEIFVRRWAQRWFENMQFIYGNQNIRWSRRYDFAIDVDLFRRESPLNQRSQTNIARVVAEALASLIYSDLPDWEVEEADESSTKGKRFRAISQKILDAYMERMMCDKEFALAAYIFVTYGQVGGKIDWNPNGNRLIEVPVYEESLLPAFQTSMTQDQTLNGLLEVPTPAQNAQGQPYMAQRFKQMLDAVGMPQTVKKFFGDVRMGIKTPFEYMREIGSAGMHKTRYVQEVRLLDYDQYLKEYANLPGKTRYFAEIGPSSIDGQMYSYAVRHFMRLQYMTPPTLWDNFRQTGALLRGNLFRHKVLVIEWYDEPNHEVWPKGRRVIVTNGKCTHVLEPDYSTNKMDGWHPFVEAQWMVVPPSSIASGPMNDVIAKNRQINIMDGLYATSLLRNMGSQLLVKIGGGLDPQKISGTPGEIHEVNTLDAAKYLHDEQPIPPSVREWRMDHKEDCYDVSGAGDALRGDRSKNVSAGYALRQLQEREEKRLTPARKTFEYFVSGMGEKIIACLHANSKAKLDKFVMGYLKRAASGEFSATDINAFLSSPINYGVDIRVKTGTMALRSKATQQATLQELGKGPLANRLANDAEVLDNFLKYFDAEVLRDGSAIQRDNAGRENELFSDLMNLGPEVSGSRLPVVMFEDDDDIHLAKHAEWLLQNKEELLSNEAVLRSYLVHVETHRIQQKEKLGQVPVGSTVDAPAIYAQAANNPPPPVPQIAVEKDAQDKLQQQQVLRNQAAQQAQATRPGAKGKAGRPGKPPQAPKLPAPPGSKGPPQIDVNAPSQNTPTATMGGGTMQ